MSFAASRKRKFRRPATARRFIRVIQKLKVRQEDRTKMASRIALILTFFLAGCTLGPDYNRPSVLTPDNYRGLQGAPPQESLADLPWWEVFKDPVLQELTREALNNNYDLRTAAARVEEARTQIGVARSFLYPQINFNGGGSAQQVSRVTEPPQSFGGNRTFQNWLAGFGMVWEFDVFGRMRRHAGRHRNGPAWRVHHAGRRYCAILL